MSLCNSATKLYLGALLSNTDTISWVRTQHMKFKFRAPENPEPYF